MYHANFRRRALVKYFTALLKMTGIALSSLWTVVVTLIHFLQGLHRHQATGLYDALPAETRVRYDSTDVECRNQARSQVTEVTLHDPQLVDLLRVSRRLTAQISLVDQNKAAGEVLYAPADIVMVNGSLPGFEGSAFLQQTRPLNSGATCQRPRHNSPGAAA